MDAAGAAILAKRLENVNPAHLAAYGTATDRILELQARLRDEEPVKDPWWRAWPMRPPTDEEACPVCGYGLDDGSGTPHECPPGFRDSQ